MVIDNTQSMITQVCKVELLINSSKVLEMFVLNCIIVLTSITLLNAFVKAPIDVVFFIRSQNAQPHNQLSKHLKENLTRQALRLQSDYNVRVHILHELFNFPGDWTILHLIPHLLPKNPDATKRSEDVSIFITHNTQWIILCEDTTNINVHLLMKRLNDENHTQPLFLGHGLYDQEPTIIHHFAFSKNPLWFPYPLLSAGIVLSLPLVKSINDALLSNRNNQRKESILRSEFSIDAGHELARFIYDNVPVVSAQTKAAFGPLQSDTDTLQMTNTTPQQKLLLKKTSYICPGDTGRHDIECAMYTDLKPSPLSCTPIKRDEIYFAIKTCLKFHKERLPVIQRTWSSYAKHIKYFSDVQDDDIPTIAVGVPNVEMGHCAKSLQILKLALKGIMIYNDLIRNRGIRNFNLHHISNNHRTIKWLFLADDDTLLSISGVCQVLGCLDAMDDIYLGERYGYRLYASDGFNYITGGGGIVFSLSVVKLIVQYCSCPSFSAPDDMIMGSCLHSLQLRPLHSPRFHQARPNDYPLGRLQHEEPVSFHKFYQIDPLDVYRQWFFHKDDRLLLMEANDVYSDEENVYHQKKERLMGKPKMLNINDFVPVSFLTALHNSKDRHIDL